MPEPQKYKLTARQKRMLSDYQQRQHASSQTIEPSVSAIDSIESIYKALNDRDEIRAKALLMLMLRNWLTEVLNFDPVSGHALHTGIIDFLDAVAKSVQDDSPEGETKDRIYRIVSHSKESVLAIMEHTRDKILREHAMLPIHAAREVDSNSVQWLSRQPGRTLREKLSGKPYMKAVRRRSSVDTAENRLFRAFLFRLEQILIERQNVLSAAAEETCEELLVSIQRWLRTEDAAEIGAWGNLLPNNTLLQDKRYRKVWDGWLWLQAIDEQITGDGKRVHRDILSVIYWNTLSLLNHSGRFRTVQQPVGLDYDNFSIVPELPIRGYLFPGYDAKIRGKIKFIKPDKPFGFITTESGADLFFHKNNLSSKLDIKSLSAGDEVSFVIGANRQGECADDIAFPAGIIPVDFNLAGDKWKIQVGGNNYLLQIVSGNLVIEQAQGAKKKLKIEPATLKEIPKTILSLVTDAPFEYSELTNNQSAPIRVDSSVVDLCSIRPAFTNNTGSQAHLPFRLLQQHWPLNVNGGLVIDCGYAKSIALHSDIETVSMRSLFSHSSTLPDATKSSASMFFTKKLSDYIQVDKLTYLVPDWGNDFDLEGIRKSVNFYFDESTPLPKSIAAIFAWQTSKKFVQDRVRENDFVLVVDSFDGGISITPVQAIYQKELDEILPDSQGISWERHPTVIVPNRGIHTAMARNLDRNGCQTSEELLHLFGFDGLASDSGEVSFVKDDHWYHLPCSIREALTQDLDLNILSNYAISDCLNSTNRDCRGVGVFILPLEDTIRSSSRLDEKYKWINEKLSPVIGGNTLNRWQEDADNISLWRDHLPELSIRIVRDGHFENFYLVKDATVTPQRGRTVNIPVEESFTLPAGQTHYSFPLQQGEGNKELQFVAYLKSPAFPLKKATACKLKMTYTYGADDPYELKFIPLDSAEAGFKSIRVEWRSASEGEAADLENLPVPDFPARKSWSDFQKFPKEDGKSFSDLLDWIESKLSLLDTTILRDEIISNNVDRRVGRLKRERVAGTFKWGTTNNKGGYYCFVDVEGEDIYCSASSFKENVHYDSLQEGQVVYLNIVKKQDRSFGVNVSFYDEFPLVIAEEIHEYEMRRTNISPDEIIQRNAGRLEKALYSLRFPVLTIWNNGHSLSEPDVPNNFRTSIMEGINRILPIIDSPKMPDTLKEELFFFLSCLHKDAPGIVSTKLLEAAQDSQLLKKNNKNIAFAIGDAELPWQQKLLRSVISPIDNEGLIRSITLEGLAIALWRSESLVFKLSETELRKLCNDLFRCIQFDMQLLTSDIPEHRLQFHLEKGLAETEAQKRERGYQTNTLCKQLELLLALLRSRGIEGEEFKMVFAPDNDLTKKYVSLVDDVSRIVIDSDIELKSRISLQIVKPEMFRNTPDLLYALRMYLTGDSGANTIFITGVSDED
jgi:cold shock CspA family protein